MCSETMILKQEEQSISSEETHITLGEGFSPKWKWELFLIFQGLGCGSAVKCLVFVRPGFNPRHLHKIKKKKGSSRCASIEPRLSLSQCGLHGSTWFHGSG